MPSKHRFWNFKFKNCRHYYKNRKLRIYVGIFFIIDIILLIHSQATGKQLLESKQLTAITPLQIGKYQLESHGMLNISYIKVLGVQSYLQQPKVPVILRWTTAIHYNTSISMKAGQHYLKRKMKCSVFNCVFTDDRSMYLQADAIVFPRLDFLPKAQFPPKRLPHQRYVFVNREAPQHQYLTKFTFNKTFTKDFFNWTATYRSDSDFYTPYFHFLKNETKEITIQRIEYMAKKVKGKKLVAWFVSHCETHSKREEYVKELHKYIHVDIYGMCGDLKCKREQKRSCHKLLDNYWFYLSFENSLCMDYVTEKVMYPMRYAHVIPVVLGGANYSKILPPHSYIEAINFSSPKALAEYLINLTGDEDRYATYFNWKGWYRIAPPKNYICQMCSYLHEKPLVGQVYTDFTSWWNKDMCDFNWVQRNKANWS